MDLRIKYKIDELKNLLDKAEKEEIELNEENKRLVKRIEELEEILAKSKEINLIQVMQLVEKAKIMEEFLIELKKLTDDFSERIV